ncbi:MAG: hypothetical protein ACR2IE_15715 [Candidatus Sumerlaeaceae bacterium]
MSKRRPTDHSGLMSRVEAQDPHDRAFAYSPHDVGSQSAFTARGAHASSRSIAGIGGGIRLQDMALDNEPRTPIAPLERPISLTGQRIARGMLCFALLGGLAVAHVQLRFVINDSRLQRQRMQRVHRELLQNYAMLERANAHLSDYDRLRSYATNELHMVEVQDHPVATIGAELRHKYSDEAMMQARRNTATDTAIAGGVSSLRNVTTGNLRKLVDTGRAALAGQPQL